MVVNVHVDDELIAAERAEDIGWIIKELQKLYQLQVEGPFPVGGLGSGEELGYLKKTYTFQEDGIYTKSNPKYVENLLKLYNLEDRKEKQVPEHCLLSDPDTSPELDATRQATFRSGLGIAMCMSHDRLDIQFCVKSLASSMRAPTEQAERCLIQLILYLNGARDFAFRLPYTPIGTRMSGKLNNAPELGSGRKHTCDGGVLR